MALLIPDAPPDAGWAIARVRCAGHDDERRAHVADQATALLGPGTDVVPDVERVALGPRDLLAVDGVSGVPCADLYRAFAAAHPVFVARDRPVLSGPLAVLDDGGPASLPAVCFGLALVDRYALDVLLVRLGPVDPDDATPALLRRHARRVETVDGASPQTVLRVLQRRGAGLVVVSGEAPAAEPGRVAATAPCSVLVVR